MSLLVAFYILAAVTVLVLVTAAAGLLVLAARAADWTRVYLGFDLYPDWIIPEHPHQMEETR